MFDIGFSELLLIAVVALIVLGPERLPKAARFAGLWVRRARQQWYSVKSEFENELASEELKRSLRETQETLRSAEAQLREGAGALQQQVAELEAQATAPGPAPQAAADATPDATSDATPGAAPDAGHEHADMRLESAREMDEMEPPPPVESDDEDEGAPPAAADAGPASRTPQSGDADAQR